MNEIWFLVIGLTVGLLVSTLVHRYLDRMNVCTHKLALEMIRDGNPYLHDRLQSAWMQEVAEQALGED